MSNGGNRTLWRDWVLKVYYVDGNNKHSVEMLEQKQAEYLVYGKWLK